MSDKPKTIQEALAEVQRNINEQQKNNMINEYEALSGAGQWLADRKRPGDTWYKDKLNAAKDKVSSFFNKPANADTADYQAAKSDNTKNEPFSSVAQRMSSTPKPTPAPAPATKPATTSKPSVVSKAELDNFRKYNPGATLGQYMNTIQGKTAVKGGANDPTSSNFKADKSQSGVKWNPNDIKVSSSGTSTTLPTKSDNFNKVNVPTPPSRPSDLPKPAASGLSIPTVGFDNGVFNPRVDISAALSSKRPDVGGIAKTNWVNSDNSAFKAVNPHSFDHNFMTPSATTGNAEFPMSDKLVKPETESGKKVKKMSEETNPLIAAFLKLQTENSRNMFEAAKKAKKDYDGDGKIESEKDEVWGSRFAAAKKAGKMEEANIDPVITGSSSVTKSKTGYVDPSTPKVPYSELPKPGNAAGDVLSKAKNALDKTGVKEDVKISEEGIVDKPNDFKKGSKGQVTAPSKKILSKSDFKENIEFSEAELAHFKSVFNEASVAPNRPEVAAEARPDSVKDGVSQNDVTGTSTEGGKKKINVKEESDAADETNMAKTQLKAMAAKSMDLNKKLKMSKNLPAWVQSKLAVAKDGVTAVHDFMTHSDKIKEETLEEGRPRKNPVASEEESPVKNIAAQVRTARSMTNDGGKTFTIPLKHPVSGKVHHVPQKAVDDFNKSYAAARKADEKEAVETAFKNKHMSE
jgi:hypothetical protein